MNEKLKQVIENAIKEEEYFYNFYKKSAEVAENPEIKEELLKLAEFEKLHKEKLETLNFEEIGDKVVPEKLGVIQITDEDILLPFEKFESLKQMFEFAIKQEIAARKTYEILRDSIDDEAAKEMFNKLAQDEANHEMVLTEKLNNLKE